jgi:hypothetical protein
MVLLPAAEVEVPERPNPCLEGNMPSSIKTTMEIDLKKWPNHWPPPCKFLGPLVFTISSLRCNSSLTEHQAIIRFKNRYGVRISENLFHEGLFLVAVLKFHGPREGGYDLVHQFPFPDLTWYCTGPEIFSLSERVAQWARPVLTGSRRLTLPPSPVPLSFWGRGEKRPPISQRPPFRGR